MPNQSTLGRLQVNVQGMRNGNPTGRTARLSRGALHLAIK